MSRQSCTFFIVAVATCASAAGEGLRGDAYDQAGGRLLYRETHYVYRDEGEDRRLVLYTCPDGRAFARKIMRVSGDAQTPDFDLVDARQGYREGVRATPAGREVYAQRGHEQAESATPLTVPDGAVIDSGLDVFAQRHWDALLRGDALRFALLVPSRHQFYGMTVRKSATQPSMHLRLQIELDAWFAFILPRFEVDYDIATKALRHYSGIANIRDAAAKNYRVRIEFAAFTPTDSWHDALNAPLQTSCESVRADTAMSASANTH